MLIKPFTATVNGSGEAILLVTHALHGITWRIYQIGFGLGHPAPSPQVAAHVNGVPLAATVSMQQSVFASITGQAPYAMESFFVGPPWMDIEAGDAITCAVLGANPGDVFTAAAYIDEGPSGTFGPIG
jgi:hypothetical protein